MKNMNKKSSKKTSAKKSSVSIKSEDNEFDNVDSLVFLNDPKERKRLDGIDERIKFLKTELKSLLGDIKMNENSDLFAGKRNSEVTLPLYAKRPEDLETGIKSSDKGKSLKELQKSEPEEFRPTFNSTPSKFSAWLSKTVDEMESKNQNKKPNVQTQPPNSSSVPLLTQDSVEQLLYKSFLLQNSELHLSASEISDAEPEVSTRKTRQQKFKKSKNTQKRVSMERPTQNSFRPYRRYLRRGAGRRLSNVSSPNGVEPINYHNSPGCSKIPKKSIECVDLDVSDYDWSEPFEINKETQETHADVQVLEYCKGKSDYKSHKKLNSNSPELTESNSSICLDESGETQAKKAWECPVCFERSKGQEIVATQCGHVFCRKCLENHISKLSNNCPSCRCDLKDKAFITLFNF